MRYWTDEEGRPHCEEANWLPMPAETEGAVQLPPEVMATSSAPGDTWSGWGVPAGVTAPAVDPAAVAAEPHRLYELPLRDGAELVSYSEWLVAQQAAEEALVAQQAAVDAQLAEQAAERGEAREAAIRAFAEQAGVSTEVAEQLIGAL